MKYDKKLGQVFAFSGWSRDRLSDLIGVSNNTMDSWVNGKSEPKGKNAELIDEIYAELVEPYVCELEKKADEIAARLLRRHVRKLLEDNVCEN